MSVIREGRPFQLFPGKILSVDADNRLVTVIDLLGNSKKGNVILVTNPGVFSSPKTGDVGLVIGTELAYYFLGKIDYGYARKLLGESPYPYKDLDEQYVKAEEGEARISNTSKGVGLHFSNSGGFTLVDRFQRGIKYIVSSMLAGPLQWLQLLGKRVSLLAPGKVAEVSAGAVIRNLPAVGDAVVLDPLAAGTAAYEVLAAIRNPLGLVRERIQIGSIMQEPIATQFTAIPEPNPTTGGIVRAVIEVKDPAGVLAVGSIKIDQLGSIEIKATPQLILDSLLTYVGGNAISAIEPAVLGDKLITWLNTHTHPTGVGPSGPPTAIATRLDFCSLKVYVA